jgi:hypothetical protein
VWDLEFPAAIHLPSDVIVIGELAENANPVHRLSADWSGRN